MFEIHLSTIDSRFLLKKPISWLQKAHQAYIQIIARVRLHHAGAGVQHFPLTAVGLLGSISTTWQSRTAVQAPCREFTSLWTSLPVHGIYRTRYCGLISQFARPNIATTRYTPFCWMPFNSILSPRTRFRKLPTSRTKYWQHCEITLATTICTVSISLLHMVQIDEWSCESSALVHVIAQK
jgi:hypothetical protein